MLAVGFIVQNVYILSLLKKKKKKAKINILKTDAPDDLKWICIWLTFHNYFLCVSFTRDSKRILIFYFQILSPIK